MIPELTIESRIASMAGVERRFLGWSRPFLPEAARELSAAYMREGELRMDGAVVVVPGGRAGRRLKELLLARAEQADVRLVPPRIVTVGALPELLYVSQRPVAGDALSRRAWVAALREVPAVRLRAVFPTTPVPDDLIGWTRLAGVVEGLHRDVSAGGVAFSGVADRCEDGFHFDDAERWRVLAEVQANYVRRLRGFGFDDPGVARMSALQGEPVGLGADLWLTGVVEMPPVVKALVAAVAARDREIRALVHAPEEEAPGFDALGCVVPSAWSRRPVPLTDEVLSVVGRPADQADEALRALAALDGRYAPEEIVVAVPDEEVLPYVEQRLESAGVPVRRATGAGVQRTGAARLLAAIADYLDGHRYDACAVLARHPDFARWMRRGGASGDGAAGFSPGSWLGDLDAHFAERLPLRLKGGAVEGSRRHSHRVRDLCRVLDGRRVLGRLTGTRSLTEWMPEILDLLLDTYGDLPLDRTVPEQRDLLESLSRVKDAAAELHRLPAEADERCGAADAIRLLLDAAGSGTLTPRADDAAVELLGWLELHLDDAPVAVVTGLNEGILPESVNAHTYLPDSLRARLGLVDNAARYARDAYQMTALIQSRDELKVIAGRRTVRGDPLRPSRLMFAVDGPALAERVKRFYGDQAETRPGTPDGVDSGSGSRFQLPPQPVLTLTEPITRLSVSRFGAVLSDPYVFALETVLGLGAMDDAATELDGLSFGSLAHEVLEAFGRDPDAASSTDGRRIARVLDEILDDVVSKRYGADALPAVRLQTEQLRARLHAFAGWQAGWAADGWRIVGVECRTPDDGAPMIVDGLPFAVTGRIDRIDYHAERDEWAIFDYKTSDAGKPPEKTHRRGRGADREWKDLQLPLYRHILPAVVDSEGRAPFTGRDPGGVRLGYILLPRDAALAGGCIAGWTDAELDEADEAARAVIRFLRDGVFTWDPDTARAPHDPRLGALLGLGYLENAVAADAEVGDEQ